MENRICFLVWGFQPFPPHPEAPPLLEWLKASQVGRGGSTDHRSPVSGRGWGTWSACLPALRSDPRTTSKRTRAA